MKKFFINFIKFLEIEIPNSEVEELKEKLLFENNMRVQALEMLAKKEQRLNERLVKNLNQEREIRALKYQVRKLEKQLSVTEEMYKNRTRTSMIQIQEAKRLEGCINYDAETEIEAVLP